MDLGGAPFAELRRERRVTDEQRMDRTSRGEPDAERQRLLGHPIDGGVRGHDQDERGSHA